MNGFVYSPEQSYNLGSTLIILSDIWCFVAFISFWKKRHINFYLEIVLAIIFYLFSMVLLLNGILYSPGMAVLKLIFHSILVLIPVVLFQRKKEPKNKRKEDMGDSGIYIEGDSGNSERHSFRDHISKEYMKGIHKEKMEEPRKKI